MTDEQDGSVQCADAECRHRKDMHAGFMGAIGVLACAEPGCSCPGFDYGLAIDTPTPSEKKRHLRIVRKGDES